MLIARDVVPSHFHDFVLFRLHERVDLPHVLIVDLLQVLFGVLHVVLGHAVELLEARPAFGPPVAHTDAPFLREFVHDLHQVAPNARILLLGGYNPVPKHQMAPLIDHYLEIWNATLADRFKNDALVTVVKMNDIVTPDRLSRRDGFHPSGAAYERAAERVAELLRKDDRG